MKTILFFCLLAPLVAFSDDLVELDEVNDADNKLKAFVESAPTGWYFFKEKKFKKKLKKKKIKAKKEKLVKPVTPPPFKPFTGVMPPLNVIPLDPIAELKEVQKRIEKAQAMVALHPTPENTEKWLQTIQPVLERESLFADQAKRIIWGKPKYDYALVRPNNPSGLSVYANNFNKDKDKTLRELAKDHGLIYFIKKSCPYCSEFAPFLKRFAQNYGFEIIAITIDGGAIKDFPEPLYRPKLVRKLKIEFTPALYLSKPEESIIPIGFGVLSITDLEDRIYSLTKLKPGQMYQVSKNN